MPRELGSINASIVNFFIDIPVPVRIFIFFRKSLNFLANTKFLKYSDFLFFKLKDVYLNILDYLKNSRHGNRYILFSKIKENNLMIMINENFIHQ